MLCILSNGSFNVNPGDYVRCSGASSGFCNTRVTRDLNTIWEVVRVSADKIHATPITSGYDFGDVLHNNYNISYHGNNEDIFYWFPPHIMDYVGPAGSDYTQLHNYCYYCGSICDDGEAIDGRHICETCKSFRTFVCAECGNIHDTRRRMRGSNICRPCFDNNRDKYARAADDGLVHLISDMVRIDNSYYTQGYAEANSFVCDVCGSRHLTNNRIKIGNKKLCIACADESYPICPSCHRRHVRRNCIKVVTGEYICARCLANKYQRCDICGEWENVFTLIRPEDSDKKYCRKCKHSLHKCNECGKMYVDESSIQTLEVSKTSPFLREIHVCPSCSNKFAKCEDCNLYVRKASTTPGPDGKYYCETHFLNHFVRCSECGKAIPISSQIHGSDTNILCDTCYVSMNHGTRFCLDGSTTTFDCPSGVRNYGYKPAPILYPDKNTNGLYGGIELEVDYGNNPGVTADNANNMMKITYAKHDGSLRHNGIEFVSHPATMEWFMEHKDNFAKAMIYLRDCGYSSHSAGTCGLHVHISSFPLIYDTEHGIEKLLYLQNKHWDKLLTFSRREPSELRRWSNRINVDGISNFPFADNDTRIKVLKSAKEKTINNGRYQCINLQNKNTVEFRLMRGTLNIDTFIATLQLIFNMCELAIEKTLDEIYALSWDDIIARHDYAELKSYWATRDVSNVAHNTIDNDNFKISEDTITLAA